MDDGSINPKINIHDERIPCGVRFGHIYPNESPCKGCVFRIVCDADYVHEANERRERLEIIYPKLFDGTVKTRQEYLEYIKGNFDTGRK